MQGNELLLSSFRCDTVKSCFRHDNGRASATELRGSTPMECIDSSTVLSFCFESSVFPEQHSISSDKLCEGISIDFTSNHI